MGEADSYAKSIVYESFARLQRKQRREKHLAAISLPLILILGAVATLLVWHYVSGVDAGRVVLLTTGALASWMGLVSSSSWWWRSRPLTPLYGFGGALIGSSISSFFLYR